MYMFFVQEDQLLSKRKKIDKEKKNQYFLGFYKF